MREGNLEAPVRHPYDWRNPEFWDEAALERETRRIFDLCHGCRRCFNLCDSFPRLFDLIDAAGDAELAGVASKDLAQVVDACTLCDMCFLTKCPYVPPHDFNIDFPHLMVRHRAVTRKKRGAGFIESQLAETDRNGKLAAPVAGLANWATRRENKLTRPLLDKVAGIHPDAEIPRYHGKTFMARAKENPPSVNAAAPAYGKRKVALFATCFANYNEPQLGEAALKVLAHNGVAVEAVYPGCCGMPRLEQGDLEGVADSAKRIAAALREKVDQGFDIVAPVPSCALMMKFEWPLLSPDDPDIKALAQAAFDISEYMVMIARKEGLADGMKPLLGGVALHLSCHARAQNMGAKGLEMLRLIPEAAVTAIERCSGHGGAWGIRSENFPTALKVGKPAARAAATAFKDGKAAYLCSECPLAGAHLRQGMEAFPESPIPARTRHPIEALALSYGLIAEGDGA